LRFASKWFDPCGCPLGYGHEASGSADATWRAYHAHPSLSEVVHDAMAVSKPAIHEAN
jgi:hypothetical protein